VLLLMLMALEAFISRRLLQFTGEEIGTQRPFVRLYKQSTLHSIHVQYSVESAADAGLGLYSSNSIVLLSYRSLTLITIQWQQWFWCRCGCFFSDWQQERPLI
jgi:hypothetical protein